MQYGMAGKTASKHSRIDLGLPGKLITRLVTRFSMVEMFTQEDFTIVKNPGKENMEIITKSGEEIT